MLKDKVLWSVDFKYNEHEGEIEDPLYAVKEDDNGYFHILYYGLCGMHMTESLTEAKEHVRQLLEPAKAIRKHRELEKQNRVRKYQKLLKEMEVQ